MLNWKVSLLEWLQQPRTQRVLVAGPLALIAALAVLAGMPHWVPEGPGRVDNLIFPVLAFPLIWAVTFFYACMADDVLKAAIVLGIVTVIQAAIIGGSLYLAK